ncbi:MAG: glycosyltransferase family 4 protein [Phycisphaerae bacterium]|nr:glycosyltransferase family 4 protein [Phycisphaerae bacterium]
MKIALIIEGMDPSRGGRETSTAQIATALAKRGHAVTVLCQSGCWDEPSVELRQLGKTGLDRTGRLRRFIVNVQEAVAEGKFDVTHAMLPVPGVDIYQPRGGTVPAQRQASRRRRNLPGKILSKLGDSLNSHRRYMAQLERTVAHDQHTICLAGSGMVAREFERYYRRSKNVRVVFNAVDIPNISDGQRNLWRQQSRWGIGAGPDDVVFLTIAKNFELKGVEQTISAFARWRQSKPGSAGSHLVIIGRKEFQHYNTIAAKQKLGESVHFLPPMGDVFHWYAATDVCVLLSWYDACSRVVLEAARWGIPSITTAFNGAAEVLDTGGGEIVEGPDDIDGVVEAMDKLSNPAWRAKAKQACLAQADDLSMARQIDELETIYQEIAAR